ncbi:MAG: HD domain-containing protein [archaeon]
MVDKEFFDKLKEKAKSYSEDGGSHDFSHTERVYNLALLISKDENADLDVVKAATLLHDIAREKEHKKECECHAEEGAIMAEQILKEMNFPQDKISRVAYAIKVHRHSTNITPETIEAAILQDADRLDALGAIAIARMFASGGRAKIPLYNPEQKPTAHTYKGQKSTIEGFHKKILKITPETFKTAKAKEIAKERYQFVEDFLERFIKEWNGKE